MKNIAQFQRQMFVFLVACLGVTLSVPVMAGIVTLDFNVDPMGIQTDPYLEDGFEIEVVNCHYDLAPGFPAGNSVGSDGSVWMGFDNGGGCGPELAELRLHMFGQEFDILSLDVIFGEYTIMSSNGGVFDACSIGPSCSGLGNNVLSGPEWIGVSWITFTAQSNLGEPVGFDNVQLNVISSPATVLLVLGAVVGMTIAFRRRRGTTALSAL